MRFALCLLLASLSAAAHVTSVSSGDLAIDGSSARYEFRIPLYEVEHVPHPEETLLAHVKFAGARMVSKDCKPDPPTESYVCRAEYTFAKPVEDLEVECTLPAVTVPNHVHLLHATRNGRREDAVLDSGVTRIKLRFRAPGSGEGAVTEATAGVLRALASPAGWLFLAGLALAAHSRRELVQTAAAFFAGEGAAVWVAMLAAWFPAPGFVEAASALTVAYLAVEILILPNAGARWMMVGAMGVFHGLWLLLFIQNTQYRASFVIAGAVIAQAGIVAAMAWAAARIPRPQAAKAAAVAMLVFGLIWFALQLR